MDFSILGKQKNQQSREVDNKSDQLHSHEGSPSKQTPFQKFAIQDRQRYQISQKIENGKLYGDPKITQKIDRMKQAGDNGQTPLDELINMTKTLWQWCEKKCVEHGNNREKWNTYNDIANQFQAIHEYLQRLDNAQGDDAIKIYKTIDLSISDDKQLYHNHDVIQRLQRKWNTLKLQSDQATSQDRVQRVQSTEVTASSSQNISDSLLVEGSSTKKRKRLTHEELDRRYAVAQARSTKAKEVGNKPWSEISEEERENFKRRCIYSEILLEGSDSKTRANKLKKSNDKWDLMSKEERDTAYNRLDSKKRQALEAESNLTSSSDVPGTITFAKWS